MPFVRTVPVAEAEGDVRDMYARFQDQMGHVPNYAKAFSLRPGVMDGWTSLLKSIRSNMTLRDYELATLAAARALRSSYCLLAHGSVLAEKELDNDNDAVAAIARGDGSLEPKERALMDFAAKVTRNALEVSRADVDALREHGYDDEAIFDIAATAAARCFFSKLLDALGAEPDASYRDKPRAFLEAMVLGRPISEAPDEVL